MCTADTAREKYVKLRTPVMHKLTDHNYNINIK